MKILLSALAPVALMGAASAQQNLVQLPAGADTTVVPAGVVTTPTGFNPRATTGCDDFNRTTGLGADWAPTFGAPFILNDAYASVANGNAQYVPASVAHDAAVVFFDLPDNPMNLTFGAAMLGVGGADNLYIKLQSNGTGLGTYNTIGFYTGQGTNTSGTTGWGGFFGLTTPVTGGWVTTYVDPNSGGDLLNVDLDFDRDGVVDQMLVAPNSTLTGNGSLLTAFPSGTFGMGIGIGAYGDGVTADLDDFELNSGCVPSGPSLSLVGTCPGVVGVTMSGLTPSAQVALVVGASGSFSIPAGRPCAGTALGLNPMLIPNGPLYFVLTADGNGDINLPALGNASPAACGFAQLVAVDLSNCVLTNIVNV